MSSQINMNRDPVEDYDRLALLLRKEYDARLRDAAEEAWNRMTKAERLAWLKLDQPRRIAFSYRPL